MSSFMSLNFSADLLKSTGSWEIDLVINYIECKLVRKFSKKIKMSTTFMSNTKRMLSFLKTAIPPKLP